MTAPTLLIVGGAGYGVIKLNQQAAALMNCEKKLTLVPSATHPFEEPCNLQSATSSAQRGGLVRAVSVIPFHNKNSALCGSGFSRAQQFHACWKTMFRTPLKIHISSRLMEQLAIPLSCQTTSTKWLVMMKLLAIRLSCHKDDSQVAGYAALRKNFLAYISYICGATKFFPRLAFGRNLNF